MIGQLLSPHRERDRTSNAAHGGVYEGSRATVKENLPRTRLCSGASRLPDLTAGMAVGEQSDCAIFMIKYEDIFHLPLEEARAALGIPPLPLDAKQVAEFEEKVGSLSPPKPYSEQVTAISGNTPNPFSAATDIQFSLAKRSHGKITVFDLLGRRVADVLDKTLPAGAFAAHWDGRDINGERVAAGVYYSRLTTPEASRSHAMVLIR